MSNPSRNTSMTQCAYPTATPLRPYEMVLYHDPLSHFGRNVIKDYHLPTLVSTVQQPDGNVDRSVLVGAKHPWVPMPRSATVGIIGAGVGGLYAAMMLESLGIQCEIVEASNRCGGRLFTYRFTDAKHDYYVPNIPEDFAEYNCDTLFDNVVDPFVQAIADDFKNDSKTGWDLMMQYDRYSTRLTESVLDSLAFAFPQEELKRYFIDHPKPEKSVRLTFVDGQTKSYAHVINTSTLASLRTMDLSDAYLDPAQNMVLRQLTDGPGAKIGVKFKTAWWEDPRVMTTFGPIVGGQSFTDRMVRTVVYPSYGAGTSQPSTVLIVSYTWTVDAVRWGALLADSSGERLKEIVLRDLAVIHGFDPVEGVAFLREQWADHFPFSWMNNPHTIGAFGLFGPSQFIQVFKNLTRPAAKGRLHFAGESVSVRHGWFVGVLDASWRAVRDIVIASFPQLLDGFEQKWRKEANWNDSIAARQFAISMHLQGKKWLWFNVPTHKPAIRAYFILPMLVSRDELSENSYANGGYAQRPHLVNCAKA
ncbi:uncharacterized protein LAESUDRAFT_711566 [Laetiporus sulphureus 93-53]|uniref:Amine oxidase domain-containing protein n=1 Tax=Laetiporus sulphureus 93-53 TaxID=1314785 RepID=A0A165GHQ0_9APHY|nr:uncharacterized protein LAESUDRAFT_711566 [Laetiporus sulphureus 93-53]KZT10364.1 hypothetical protein LAESUDRAFT_711566 [Laetiporus sulphureus 93-53]